MHLVFLNQYYPPDAAPTGVMLEGVISQSLAEGHQVTVLSAAGGYAAAKNMNDRCGEAEGSQPDPSFRLIRLGATRFGRGTFVGKLVDYSSYYLGVAWKLASLHPRPDRIVALTTPPYLSLIARFFSKFRKADHAHWVMDLYPDVMAAHGMLGAGSPIYRFLEGLARWGFGGSRCHAIVTLGPDMAEKTEHYMQSFSVGKVQWIPLWGGSEQMTGEEVLPSRDARLSDFSVALRRKRGWQDDEMIVMYSGNMGLGHRFGEILAAAASMAGGETKASDQKSEVGERRAGESTSPICTHLQLSTPCSAASRTRFAFFGGGKRREEIATFILGHPSASVELHDYASAGELTAHLLSADVHLVSLEPAWTGTMVPSKLQGIFSVGKPVIFIGSAESSIGCWVEQSGGGWVVEPGDADGLIKVLDQARDPAVREARGLAAQRFSQKHFDKKTNVARMAEILAGAGNSVS